MVLCASPTLLGQHRVHQHHEPTLTATERSIDLAASTINLIDPEDGKFFVHRNVGAAWRYDTADPEHSFTVALTAKFIVRY
jgi:hypothetical protein